jgi:glutaconyl-CoA decarboxylase
MMKKFNVTVNGSTYSVEVEEVGGAVSVAPAVAAAPVVAAPVAAPAAAPVAAGTTTVDAPMPGKVLSVNVKKGDKVASGDVLLILEAMKMQNEIMAPSDGVVSDIRVNAGDTVATGDVMIVM